MIRLFIAVAVQGDAAEALAAIQSGVPGANWTSPDDFHLTLRFIGDIAEPDADDLDAALEGVAAPPFQLEIAGVGAFDERGRPTSLWGGVRADPALTKLRERCVSACRRSELRPDPRAWRPHVTLAYLRRRAARYGRPLDRGAQSGEGSARRGHRVRPLFQPARRGRRALSPGALLPPLLIPA